MIGLNKFNYSHSIININTTNSNQEMVEKSGEQPRLKRMKEIEHDMVEKFKNEQLY